MTSGSAYRREHQGKVPGNDELLMLTEPAIGEINSAYNYFVASIGSATTASAGETLALKRAMARFLIDSGIASTEGWIVGT